MSLNLAQPLPKGCEYLADIAAEVAPKFNLSPYLLLGICYAESNFGLALKPSGPAGSGDFIARQATPERDALMAKTKLPGVERKEVPAIKARGIDHPVTAWVPTTTGWGLGLFQLDWESHFEFVKTGDWKDAKKAMEYACKLLAGNRKYLAGKHPELSKVDLERAMIASYNAGAGRINKFLNDKKDIDKATFHPGYIAKICNKADSLAGASGAFMPQSSPTV